MAWRDRLRPASFRGVEFYVETSEVSTGRRTQQHEFAQKDKPFTEDLGRRGRQYSVEAYLVDQDYFDLRDALITACEKEGAGELIHPYLGNLQVHCTDCKFRESKKEGAFVSFSLTFVEAGEQKFPDQSNDSIYKVNLAADNVVAASKKSFGEKYDMLRKPQFVIDSATKKVQAFADQVDKQSKSYSDTAATITDLALSIKKLKGSVLSIINKPAELSEQMASAMSLLSQASNSPKEIYEKSKSLFSFGNADTKIAILTPSRAAEAQNSKALNDLTRQISFAETMRAAVQIDLASTEDARALRQEILDTIDNQMESTESDDVYQALQTLLASVVTAIPNEDESLAQVGVLNLNESLPSIVVAYNLYESEIYEDDLISRNAVEHPGFMPNGRDLEVLEIE